MNMVICYTISTTLVNVNIFHNLKNQRGQKNLSLGLTIGSLFTDLNWKGSQLVCNLSVFPSQEHLRIWHWTKWFLKLFFLNEFSGLKHTHFFYLSSEGPKSKASFIWLKIKMLADVLSFQRSKWKIWFLVFSCF